jgi:uncharacterized membrane protein required for colicin V production
MNWLLPAVLIFLLLAAWDGHRRGFIKKSVGIISLILTLTITSVASPYIAKFLQKHTPLYAVLQRGIASSKVDVFEILEIIGLGEAVSGYLAEILLQGIGFLISLMMVGILVQGIAFSLGIVARLPVLNGINRLAGLLLGLAEGILIVWIFFLVVTIFSATKTGGNLLLMIADSEVLSWIYRNNWLLHLLKI